MNLRRFRAPLALSAAMLALTATPALAERGSEAEAVTAAAPDEPQATVDPAQPAPGNSIP